MIRAAKLLARLQAEIEKDPRVADYEIIWSNADYLPFEIRHEGKWIMLGRL